MDNNSNDIKKEDSQLFGILSTVFGGLSMLPFLGVISPIGLLLGIVGLIKDGKKILAIIGTCVSLLGIATSPILWGMAGMLGCFLNPTSCEVEEVIAVEDTSALEEVFAVEETSIENTSVTSSVSMEQETGLAIWKADLTDTPIPSSAATGMVHGIDFKIEKAKMQNGILTLKQGQDFFADQEFMIFTFLKTGEVLNGKKFMIKPDVGFGGPHIHFKYRVEGKTMPKTEVFMKGYSMKLEFGKASGKKILGKIYLCLPDKAKSFVAGTFEAEID